MKQDIFQNQKQKQLSKSDKSSIASWDQKIKFLCNKINKKKNYYTTSSCSGRIVLLKYSETKQKDAFLFRIHKKTNFKELSSALKTASYPGIIEFQQTSCIMHVACKTLEDAQSLVNKAKFAGWKRSGIMSTNPERYMVELHSTENMSFPIAKNKKSLVSDEFLKLIIEQANNKLERVWNKIKRLEKSI